MPARSRRRAAGAAPSARPAVSEEVRDDGVVLRRSARRRRTVSARREGGRTVVLLPAGLPRAQEQGLVADVLARLEAGDRRRRPGDEELERRAEQLSRRYLDGRARPTSVRWWRQERRWGSCTTTTGAIRLSSRLQGVPSYVLDHVLLHELVHLLEPDHGPGFHALLARDPHAERARGFLQGVEFAEGRPVDEDDVDA